MDENKTSSLPFDVQESGDYLIDFRCSNGTGPINTDDNCCIRSVYVDNEYQYVSVMPQRGHGELSDWSNSNVLHVNLNKGRNNLKLIFEDWSHNMNFQINEALLDHVRMIKMEAAKMKIASIFY